MYINTKHLFEHKAKLHWIKLVSKMGYKFIQQQGTNNDFCANFEISKLFYKSGKSSKF